MTASLSSSSMASAANRQQIVQITSVDPTTNTATGLTAQNQPLTINTRYMVGAVHYTPGAGEQWYVKQVGTVTWALDRKLPAYTNDLANVADNPVAGQVQIGSSGIVSGPLTLMGSTINAQAPISLLSASTAALPAASAAGEGAIAYNSTTSQAVISDGTSWNPVASGTTTPPTDTTVTWSEITGIPATFPSDWSEITNIPADFPTSWNDITGIPTTFPPTLPTGTPSSINFWCGDGTWKVPAGGEGGSGFQLVVGATPTGTVDGTNTVFTLPAFTPDSTMVYLNGTRQQRGVAYTETGDTTITFTTAPAGGVSVTADYVSAEDSGGSYSTSVGDGTSTSFVLTHNLNTRNVLIALYDSSTFEEVNCDKFRTTANEVGLTFQSAPSVDAYTALIVASAATPTISGTLIAGEPPTGLVNGVNNVFNTSQPYIPASTSVFVNGLRKGINVDYIESGGTAITFGTAPASGAVILIDYLTSS